MSPQQETETKRRQGSASQRVLAQAAGQRESRGGTSLSDFARPGPPRLPQSPFVQVLLRGAQDTTEGGLRLTPQARETGRCWACITIARLRCLSNGLFPVLLSRDQSSKPVQRVGVRLTA